jgi:hypothetical protein
MFILVYGNINVQSVDLYADPNAFIKFTEPVQGSGISFANETNSSAEAYSESAILGGESCREKMFWIFDAKQVVQKFKWLSRNPTRGKEPLACIKEDYEIMKG